jgi:hypothetical protein
LFDVCAEALDAEQLRGDWGEGPDSSFLCTVVQCFAGVPENEQRGRRLPLQLKGPEIADFLIRREPAFREVVVNLRLASEFQFEKIQIEV